MGDGQFCTKGVTNLLRYDEMKDFSRELVVMLEHSFAKQHFENKRYTKPKSHKFT